MRITFALATLAVLVATTSSRAEDNRACILKATEALPHIAGLEVRKTRTRPVPAEIMAAWRGQTRPIMVDLDVVAAAFQYGAQHQPADAPEPVDRNPNRHIPRFSL